MVQPPGDEPTADREHHSSDGPTPADPGRAHPLRWISLAVAVPLAAIGVFLGSQIHVDPRYAGGAVLGKAAPTLELPTLDGRGVRLGDLRGRVVIVNFWNTWCIPCIREHPALSAFYALHAHDPDFTMIGIVRDDSDQAVRAWEHTYHDRWTIAFDPASRATVAFGTTGQPETYAISAGGVVVSDQLSQASVSNLEAMLRRARAG